MLSHRVARSVSLGLASVALAAAVAGCAPNRRGESTGEDAGHAGSPSGSAGGGSPVDHSSSEQPYDPLDGKYPQVFWMFNVYELAGPAELSESGIVAASTAMKPRGLAIVPAGGVDAVFESARRLEGARMLAVPAAIAPLGRREVIPAGSRDKAGGTLEGRSLEVSTSAVDDAVVASFEFVRSRSGEAVAVGLPDQRIPDGGALVALYSGIGPGEPWTMVIARPTVLRSLADYPFQTSSAFAAPVARPQ